jgi:hypothetical protein
MRLEIRDQRVGDVIGHALQPIVAAGAAILHGEPQEPGSPIRHFEIRVGGERTPLFLIQDRVPRYSWYLRLARGRVIESALAGVVRLETSATLDLREVQALADASCRLLPRLASDAAHDPRAPANLYPIGGLESRLRRLLGDPLLVRRAIEVRLHQEATA